MGVPMVVTNKKRRSSLAMGLLMALLLGVAAAFVVLAMPIRMLETVTTLTRLSKLMVQAEPPISPNDRTLLAVLAGIVTAGIGWVLVDWLLFGRVGMSALIRTREDDYEDEDEDAYRPTDPLDLVMPGGARGNDWQQAPSGDARRPLSARTDIGEPEPFAPPAPPHAPFGAPQPATHGLSQPLPPLGQILPGAGVSAPPLQPNVPPVAPAGLQPFGQPQPQPAPPPNPFAMQPPAPVWPPVAEETPPGLNANFDLPDRPADFGPPPTVAPAAPPPVSVAAASTTGMPSWLPAPGSRPDAETVAFDPAPVAGLPAIEPVEPPAAPPPHAPLAGMPAAPAPSFEPAPLILSQPVLPLSVSQAVPDAPVPPVVPAAVAVEPPVAAPFAPPPQAQPDPFRAPQPQAPLVAATPMAAAPVAPAQRPPAPSGIDRAQLADLLNRLEAKVQSRRAAATAAAQPPAAAQVQPAMPASTQPPAPTQTGFAPSSPALAPFPPVRTEPPSAFAAPPLQMPPPEPVPAAPVYELPHTQPPPAFNLGVQPQVHAVLPEPAPAPASPPIPLPMIDAARNDEMLNQPLHVTLDALRNMVKR